MARSIFHEGACPVISSERPDTRTRLIEAMAQAIRATGSYQAGGGPTDSTDWAGAALDALAAALSPSEGQG